MAAARAHKGLSILMQAYQEQNVQDKDTHGFLNRWDSEEVGHGAHDFCLEYEKQKQKQKMSYRRQTMGCLGDVCNGLPSQWHSSMGKVGMHVPCD